MNKLLKIILVIFIIFVVVFSAIKIISQINQVVIVSVQPDLYQQFDIYQGVTLELNKVISQSFFDSCNVKTKPFVSVELNYENNNLIISPKSRFQYSQPYQIFIECHNFSNIISFETMPYELLNDTSKAGIQIEKDIEFAQEIEKVFQDEPWREKLPLKGDNYEVNYLQSTNNYIVSFSKPVGSDLTVENILPEIKFQLKEIGAPDLEFVW